MLSFLRVLAVVLAFTVAGGYAQARADDVSNLPVWIPNDTPEDQLPVFTGSPTPNGYAGAIPVYDSDGRLSWISITGKVLSTSDSSLHVFVNDNVTVQAWAESLGLSKGEFMLLLIHAQSRQGRALSVGSLR